MQGIAVSILAESTERLALLQQRVESTQAAHVVFAHSVFPGSAPDQAVRRIQEARAEIVLVDVDPQNALTATRAIEVIHANVADVSVFAVGTLTDPSAIVAAMRAGAREYLERDATTENFADAFRRFTELHAKARASSGRARILAITNAKGGAGATTVAVNTAVALEP